MSDFLKLKEVLANIERDIQRVPGLEPNLRKRRILLRKLRTLRRECKRELRRLSAEEAEIIQDVVEDRQEIVEEVEARVDEQVQDQCPAIVQSMRIDDSSAKLVIECPVQTGSNIDAMIQTTLSQVDAKLHSVLEGNQGLTRFLHVHVELSGVVSTGSATNIRRFATFNTPIRNLDIVSQCISNLDKELYASVFNMTTLFICQFHFIVNAESPRAGNNVTSNARHDNHDRRVEKAHSYLEIKNSDNRCLGRACYLANMFHKLERNSEIREKLSRQQYYAERKKLTKYAVEGQKGYKLHSKRMIAFFKTNRYQPIIDNVKAKLEDTYEMAKIFKKNIIVWSRSQGDVLAKSIYSDECSEYLHLVYYDEHFDVLLCPIKFFGGCMNSFTGACYHCLEVTARTNNKAIFKSLYTQKKHITTCSHYRQQTGKTVTDFQEQCEKCGKFLSKTKEHKCIIQCHVCYEPLYPDKPDDHELSIKNHKCFLNAADVKEMTKCNKYIMYDYETYVDPQTKQHIPNLVVAQYSDPKDFQSYVADTKRKEKKDELDIFPDDTIFNGSIIFTRPCIPDSLITQYREDGHVVIVDEDVNKAFADWCLLKRHKGKDFYAHNGAKYDNLLIYKELRNRRESEGLQLKINNNGQSITGITVKSQFTKINFKDSYKVLSIPLGGFHFNLDLDTDVKKGYFPHFFNTIENQNYIGAYPAKSFYGYDTMTDKAKADFDKWYRTTEGQTFDFQQEFIDYCISDVHVLKDGMLKFRKVFADILTESGFKAFDCFTASTTAALSMIVYRTYFQGRNRIPIERIPRKFTQSKIAAQWLKYVEKCCGYDDLRTFSNGEVIIEANGVRYPVDGYSESKKTIFQFDGCYFHGHNCPIGRRKADNFVVDKYKINENQKHTQKRDKALKKWCEENGFTYQVMHECQWEELRQNPIVSKELPKLGDVTFVKTISPREGFGGGRTNATQLYVNCEGTEEELCYVDFTSLYPYIYRILPLPRSHGIQTERYEAKQFMSDYFDVKQRLGFGDRNRYNSIELINEMIVDAYEYSDTWDKIPLGLIKCRVSIPKHLVHSPLGCKQVIQGETKLVFDNRDKIQTIPTPELYRLLDLGGEILEIYNAFIFEEIEHTLFQDFCDFFFKLKTVNAGLGDIGTEDDLAEYIQEYNRRYKYPIKIEDFPRNEDGQIVKRNGLKLLAKLLINSFFGKFGQDNSRYSSGKILHDANEILFFFNDKSFDIQTLESIYEADDLMFVTCKTKEDATRVSQYQNCCVASLITASARSKLYDLIHEIDGQCTSIQESKVCYFDTDSVIFRGTPLEIKELQHQFEFSCFLGGLTFEFDFDKYRCQEFCGLGPKTYSLKLVDRNNPENISYLVKSKGFTLNGENAKAINHHTYKSAALSYVAIAEKYGITMSEAQNLMKQLSLVINKSSTEKLHLTGEPDIDRIIQDKIAFQKGLVEIEKKYSNCTSGNPIYHELREKHALKNEFMKRVDNHLIKFLPALSHLFKRDVKESSITSIVQLKYATVNYNKRQLHSYTRKPNGDVAVIYTNPYSWSPFR
jgi:hypothetical protein